MKHFYLFLLLACSLELFAQRSHLIAFRRTLRSHQLCVELNTQLGHLSPSSTSFSYSSDGEKSALHAGAEMGYFLIEQLAIKLGGGYHRLHQNGITDQWLSYKMGLKYYLLELFPIGADFSGRYDNGTHTKSIGAQVGYALHLTEKLTVEPSGRYERLSTGDKKNLFGLHIGFVLFF